MNIRKIINSYVECNEFKIEYKNNKVTVYYYDKINHFSNNLIEIINNNNKYIIEGEKLVIETLYKEFLIISGQILLIKLVTYNE